MVFFFFQPEKQQFSVYFFRPVKENIPNLKIINQTLRTNFGGSSIYQGSRPIPDDGSRQRQEL